MGTASRGHTIPAGLLLADLLHEALVDIQPGKSERGNNESEQREPQSKTLRGALEQLRKRLEARANSLGRKRRTRTDRVHWQTRGRQEFLRSATGHLRDLCATYSSPYELFLALKDYLGCLEKYKVDVEEEKNTSAPSAAWLIYQWKAEGVARELPALCATLIHLRSEYAPAIERHLLSFDGNNLIPL